MTIDSLTHVADVKVGKVQGNSRTYPQFRLPSRYAGLVGKKARVYEIGANGENVAFVIRFGTENRGAAYDERAKRAEASFACAEPCRGFQLLT